MGSRREARQGLPANNRSTTSARSRPTGGVDDGTQGAAYPLMDVKICQPIRERWLIGSDGAAMAPQFVAELPHLD